MDDFIEVDLRTVSFDVPPQEVLSKDSVTVSVDAVVYYRICDPLKAVIQVKLTTNKMIQIIIYKKKQKIGCQL